MDASNRATRTRKASFELSEPTESKLCVRPSFVSELKWADREKNRQDTSYRPGIRNPSREQLMKAKAEFERRCESAKNKTSEEIERDGVEAVLVATKVNAEYVKTEHNGLKLLLDEDEGDLFLINIQSKQHARAHGQVTIQCGEWTNASNLFGIVAPIPEEETRVGAITCEPDMSFVPLFPWDAVDALNGPKKRVLIEIEDQHRTTPQTRQYGYNFLSSSHYARAFISIRVFPGVGGFGAAAVVWNKGPLGPPLLAIPVAPAGPVVSPRRPAWFVPVTPAEIAAQQAAASPATAAAVVAAGGGAPPLGIVVHSAFNFGSLPLSAQATAPFQQPAVAGELPAVLPFPAHLGPLPPVGPLVAGPPPPPPAAWSLHIPKDDILYLVRDRTGALVSLPPPNDCILDLTKIYDALTL